MGQLYDATREARQQRKTRRLAKYTANDTISSSRAASSEATKVAVYREDSDHETTESSEEDDEAAFEAESPKDKKSGTKRKRRVEKHPMNKDMYKIFDGSALVALGMSSASYDHPHADLPQVCCSKNMSRTRWTPMSRTDGRKRWN